MIIIGNKLMPEDGYLYVTNGEVYSKEVYLGKNDSVSNWHDTNDTPPIDPDVPVPPEEPISDFERMEAQVTYTAVVTDTLIEE